MRISASGIDRALILLSPGLLIVLGLWGVSGGGVDSLGVVLFGVGLVLFVGAGWLMPWHTDIDEQGLRRRTLFRESQLDWDDIVAIERPSGRGRKGLVARTVKRRRLVLGTTSERPDEWDQLRELVAEHAPGVSVSDPPPLHPFNRR
jgi:hypothetical protein